MRPDMLTRGEITFTEALKVVTDYLEYTSKAIPFDNFNETSWFSIQYRVIGGEISSMDGQYIIFQLLLVNRSTISYIIHTRLPRRLCGSPDPRDILFSTGSLKRRVTYIDV